MPDDEPHTGQFEPGSVAEKSPINGYAYGAWVVLMGFLIAPIVLNAAFFWAVDNLIMRKHRGVGGRYNCVLTYG